MALVFPLSFGAIYKGTVMAHQGQLLTVKGIFHEAKRYYWRILLLPLLMLVVLLVLFLLLMVSTTMFNAFTFALDEFGGYLMFVSLFCCVCSGFALLILFQVAALFNFAAIVVGDLGLFKSISATWKLFRNHFGKILVFLLVFVFINLGVSALVSIFPLVGEFILSGSLYALSPEAVTEFNRPWWFGLLYLPNLIVAIFLSVFYYGGFALQYLALMPSVPAGKKSTRRKDA